MNINQLKYFISVAEYRSFTKAANQFYISQTAITQQIQALEESMGVTLIDRSRRPIMLTPAGNVFLNEAGPFWNGWIWQSAGYVMLPPDWWELCESVIPKVMNEAICLICSAAFIRNIRTF